MKFLWICLFFVIASCASPPKETGVWDFESVRIAYDVPLTEAVSVGHVLEVHDGHYLSVGKYVPLAVSSGSPEWAKVYSTKHTYTTYSKELSDSEIRGLLRHIGLSADEVQRADVTRMTISATDRTLEVIEDRALLEDLLNSTEFPLSEIETLHSRLERGASLRMCLLEETAKQLAFVLHTKNGAKLSSELQKAINDKVSRNELSVKSKEINVTDDIVTVALRGNFVIRRVWGDLAKTKANRIVIEWNGS